MVAAATLGGSASNASSSVLPGPSLVDSIASLNGEALRGLPACLSWLQDDASSRVGVLSPASSLSSQEQPQVPISVGAASPTSGSDSADVKVESDHATSTSPAASIAPTAPSATPSATPSAFVASGGAGQDESGPLAIVKQVVNGRVSFLTSRAFETHIFSKDVLQATWQTLGRPSTELFVHPEDTLAIYTLIGQLWKGLVMSPAPADAPPLGFVHEKVLSIFRITFILGF